MQHERFTFPVDVGKVDSLSAVFLAPVSEAPASDEDVRPPVLLAHGAGAGLDSAFLVQVAEGLARRGFPVLRFDYPYMERARREERRLPPNRKDVLLAAHRAALAVLRERRPERPPLLVGKSMGARMGSYLAADGERCSGLVHLGYPLHPAGKPERLRAEHFPAIVAPALFLQGSRDTLCNLELLRPALATHGGQPQLAVIEGADHGFHVLKRSGRTDDEVLEELLDRVAAWTRDVLA